MATKQAPAEFINKIKATMKAENLGVTDLARILRVSHPTVIELVTHGKRPSLDTAVALAKWLRQSDVSILREAGLLPPEHPRDTWEDETLYKLQKLPPSVRSIAERFIDSMADSEEREKQKPKLNPRKTG